MGERRKNFLPLRKRLFMDYIRPDFIQIPYVVLEDTRITDTAAKVYGMVYFLSQLSRKKCTASNDYIATLLWTSPGVVANALTLLENCGFIKRMFVDDNAKKGRTEIIPLVQYHSPTNVRSIHAKVKDHSPTSEQRETSNEKSIPRVEVVKDEDKPTRVKKDTGYLAVFGLWEKPALNWRANTTEINAAKNLLIEHGLLNCKKALEFYEDYKDTDKCPQILKPSDLDRKWINLVTFKRKI